MSINAFFWQISIAFFSQSKHFVEHKAIFLMKLQSLNSDVRYDFYPTEPNRTPQHVLYQCSAEPNVRSFTSLNAILLSFNSKKYFSLSFSFFSLYRALPREPFPGTVVSHERVSALDTFFVENARKELCGVTFFSSAEYKLHI